MPDEPMSQEEADTRRNVRRLLIGFKRFWSAQPQSASETNALDRVVDELIKMKDAG